MNRQQTTLFIADTSVGFDTLGLPKTQKHYSRLIGMALSQPLKAQRDFEILARTLIRICQIARPARQIAVLSEVSDFLTSLPVREELRAIGRHYQSQVLLDLGQVDVAQAICEELVSCPHFFWKGAAVGTAAACRFNSGDLEAATVLYLESLRAATKQVDVDLLVALKAQWMIGRIQGIQGDHSKALKSLESLDPLVRFVARFQPAVYYDYLNSLAVRQTALGHFSEAEQLCDIFLSSPFARNFPNWSDTRQELREAKEAVAATLFINLERPVQPEITLDSSAIEPATTRRRVTVSVFAMRSNGAGNITADLIRAKAAVAASCDGVTNPFFASVKPRAPPAFSSNR